MDTGKFDTAVVEMVDGTTVIKVNATVDDINFNNTFLNGVLIEIDDIGILHLEGMKRKTFYHSNMLSDNTYKLDLIDRIEIDEGKYVIKKSWFTKKEYVEIKKTGHYLYKKDKGTINITTSNFKIVEITKC